MATSAVFDELQVYRYSLRCTWNREEPRITFIMLNPSSADGDRTDSTIRRCISFGEKWGYGSMEVVNLFSYRTRDPRTLRSASDPVGPETDDYVISACREANTVVAGWGNQGTLHNRDQAVLTLTDCRLFCLGTTRLGMPRHPLYVRADTRLDAFRSIGDSRLASAPR